MTPDPRQAIQYARVESDDRIARAVAILATRDLDKSPDELPQAERAAIASAHAQLAQAHALHGLLLSQTQLLEQLEQTSHTLQQIATNPPPR